VQKAGLFMRVLVCLLLAVSAPGVTVADGNWVDFHSSGAYFCRSEFRLSEADVQQLLQELDALRATLETTLGITVQDRSIQLNFFEHRRSYVNYISQRVPEGTGRKALYVQDPDMGRLYAYRSLSFAIDVRHEATHALLHNALPFVPLWLDEGLAEYFEVAADERVAGSPHLRLLRWAVRFGWKPRLERLDSVVEQRSFGRGEYRESWAWVHFLLHESKESRDVLLTYFEDINRGKAPGLLSERILSEMPDAEARLVRHLQTWGR
jgi:hypothetical protein